MTTQCCLFLFSIALIQTSCAEEPIVPTCQTDGTSECTCPSGYTFEDLKCEDVDECDFLNGHCQQSCVNSIGSYKCECQIGYQLANDNHRCDDFDECSLNYGDCQLDQICVNTWGGKYCSRSSEKPVAQTQIGKDLLKKDVIIGLIAWLVVVSIIVLTTIAVMVRQTPNRRKKSLVQEAEYSGKNPDYFFPEFWPHVNVTSRSRPDAKY